MAYQVLARKWRPQDFSSLVGQEPIVTALRNALTDGRIAQAYLFSGIRGVGKTTAARVLAKALNCERGPAADPCNECVACTEITSGADLDVIEVDAATYSKVEQVRELTESLKYAPARDRYKVVVLDEVHRLSRQAFDALLKIVEEPPPYLVFIFATTEIDAVPATILSRCQEFQFRRVSVETLSTHLRRMADAESITVSDASLRSIARAGEGSVRDSVALLDQLATFGSSEIEDDDAIRLLGGLDPAFFERVLRAILAGDAPALSLAVVDIEDRGWDPRHAYSQFLAYCRDSLHLQLGGDPTRIALPAEEAERLKEIAAAAGYETLLRLLHLLLGGEEVVRRSDSGPLALEIAWLRAAEMPKLRAIEDLLQGRTPEPRIPEPMKVAPQPTLAAPELSTTPKSAPVQAPPAPTEAVPPPEPPPEPETPEQDAPLPEEPPELSAPPRASQSRKGKDPEPAATKPPPEATEASVERFLEEVSKIRQPLAAHLAEAQSLEYRERRLTIVIPGDDAWLLERLERPAYRRVLDEAFERTWAHEGDIVFERGADRPRAADAAKTETSSDPKVEEDPAVQTVLEIFGGSVDGVEPKEE